RPSTAPTPAPRPAPSGCSTSATTICPTARFWSKGHLLNATSADIPFTARITRANFHSRRVAMRTLLALGLVVAAFGVSGAADDKKDTTAGKWVIESVTRDGKATPALKGAAREHADGKYTITPAAAPTAAKKPEPVTGTYTIDATKSPVAIDMKPKGGTF